MGRTPGPRGSEMVVDKTALEGVYDFELRCPPTILTPSSDADAAPSLFTALQETLGLRPQHQKVPVDVVAVDRVDRVPTEN